MNNKKIYNYNDKKYKFNYQRFSNLLDELSSSQNKKPTSTSFLMYMEEKLNDVVRASTIKGWKCGKNSPATIETVEKVANIFGLNQTDLLIEISEDKNNMMYKKNYKDLNDAQFAILQDVYSSIIEGIARFEETCGFQYYISKSYNSSDIGKFYKQLINKIKVSRLVFETNVCEKLMYLTHSVLMHYNINYYTPDAQETAYEEERYSLLLNKNESYSDVDSEYYYFHLLANIFYTELNQILCDYLS